MMFNLQMSSTNMKLLPLACLCLLTRSGTTLADEQKPVIIKVKEDSDVILPCSLSSKENIEYKVFDWKKDGQKDVFFYDAGIHYNNGRSGQDEQFKDRVSHFQDELKYGNASIIIRNTKVTDSGNYTCEFPRRQIFHIQLVVDRILKDRSAENIPGASPKPYVTTIDETKDWELLQCEVRGAFPKPTVEWQDSAGNKLPAKEPQVSERGGSFYIILQTTVMKTDNYRCVATQEEIHHQIHTEIYVYISEPVIIKVEEDSDVILPCSLSTKENIEYKLFDWKKDGQKEVFFYEAGTHYNNGRSGQDEQFKGRVSHFQDELKSGNASIIIRNTKVTDSGDYTCDFPALQPRQIFNIQLVVGASPEPSVRTLNKTKGGVLLQCKVRGAFPKPTVEWQDSAGNKLPAEEPQVSERGGSFYIILQTTVMKTDRYRCVATQEEIKHQIYTETFVYISEPVIIIVTEGSDAILPCSLSTKEDIKYKVFDWKKDGQKEVFFYDAGSHYNNGRSGQYEQFKGRVSHFQDGLKYGNASIIIRKTKLTDSGDYTCDFPKLQPRQTFNIELVVGASPEPSVTILDETNDGMLLQCKVLGAFPKPRVEWQDSAGNKLPAEETQVSERGGSFYIILQTTVKKTDNYRCVATQEEIKHQIYTDIYVKVNGFPIGWVVAVVVLSLAVVVALLYVRHIRRNSPREPKTQQLSDDTLLQSNGIKDNASGQEDHVSHFPDKV